MDFIAWHDRTGADHQQQLDKYGAQGYRLVSLSLYDKVGDPRYAAVMLKRPTVVAQVAFHGLSAADLQARFNEQAAKGYGPTIICATGDAQHPLFAAVFEPAAAIPYTRIGLTGSEFQAANASERPGAILSWAAVYGDPGQERYAGIWRANPQQTRWNADGISEPLAVAQARYDAQVASWSRLAFTTASRGQRYLTLFTDDRIGPTVERGNLTSAGYQAAFNELIGQGYFPLVVQAAGEGAGVRFSAIFAKQETAVPRVWATPTGPTAVPAAGSAAVQAIDAAMQKIMQSSRVRAASLAVTKGTRLVLARGYTLAEPDYPITTPTTYFRIASCSKTMTALAIHRLIEQKKFALTSTMQSILDIKTPAGQPLADPNVAKVTVQHLLEMTSGLQPDYGNCDSAAVQAWNAGHPVQPSTHLPVTDEQIAAYMCSLPTAAAPGTLPAVYSNFGYFLLGQIVRKFRPGDFFRGLDDLVLHPLGINTKDDKAAGIRLSRSLAAAQRPNEARYHSADLVLRSSVMTDARPLVGRDYGDEQLEAMGPSGGLSASPVAYARMIAMFSRTALPAPIAELTPAALQTMLVEASQAGGGHGFDSADKSSGAWQVQKGGLLATSQNGMAFTVGDIGYAVCWNTLGVNGAWYPFFWDVINAAKAQDWGTTDLFPTFGMASF